MGQEEAQNIASAEDACADLDMDTVYEGLHGVTQLSLLLRLSTSSYGVQILTGCLTLGEHEEAILDGRNCLATLRAEGRFEVRVHNILECSCAWI